MQVRVFDHLFTARAMVGQENKPSLGRISGDCKNC